MSQFVHEVQQEKSYRRAIFLFVSLGLAGICSIYPVMCFKNHSTKEKDRENRGVAEVERRQMEREDEEWNHRPRSPPSLFGEAVAAPEPSPVAAGRGSGFSLDASECPLPEGTRLRSGSGQGETPSPPRPCTTEAVPPQLLGRRAEADAYFLTLPPSARSATSDSQHSSSETKSEYAKACKDSAADKLQALLSPQWHSRQGSEEAQTQSNSGLDSPPKTPSTGSSANTQASHKSAVSYASSFAYLLRDNRADRRLLHQKSQPLEHQKKHTPGSRRSMQVKRNASYYEPRVIEDSASPSIPDIAQQSLKPKASVTIAEFIKAAQPAPPSKLKDSSPRNASPVRLQKRTTFSSPILDSPSSLKTPVQLPTPPQPSPKRPLLKKLSTSQDISRHQTASKPIRLETPPAASSSPAPRSKSKESRDRSRERPKHLALPPPSKADVFTNELHYHDVTPPEAEPGSPSHSRFRHGDHYFRTFGGETMYIKEFTPTMVPIKPATPSPVNVTPLPEAVDTRERGARRPSDAGMMRQQQKRKRSSMFKLFRKSALTDSTYETPDSPIIGTRPPVPAKLVTPGISVSPPIEPPRKRIEDQRTSSDMSLPPYFARPRNHTSSDDGASSSMVSPMSKVESTKVENDTGPRPSIHSRWPSSRSSDELTVSPMSRPRSKPRIRHRVTLADMREDDERRASTVSRLPASPATVKSPAQSMPKHVRLNSKVYSETRLVGNLDTKSGALRWEPEEGHRLSTPLEEPKGPPSEKKRSIFKQFFSMSELRPQPSIASLSIPGPRAEKPEPPPSKRRSSITNKPSFASIVQMTPKPSISKLRKKASQGTVQLETSASPTSLPKPRSQYSLEVTDFQQTPYAQRVTNTRRAETTQVRAIVQEALQDDDADEVQLGFELGVPDHLPGSPLCPLSPKHKSGGKAICPLHGRKPPPPPRMPVRMPGGKMAKAEPKIVYEGVMEGAREIGGKSVDWVDVRERRPSGGLTGDAWYEEDLE